MHQALLSLLAAPIASGLRFRNTPDPTDLVTLVSTPLAWLYLRRSGR